MTPGSPVTAARLAQSGGAPPARAAVVRLFRQLRRRFREGRHDLGARLRLGAYWPTDVVAGTLVGAAVLAVLM